MWIRLRRIASSKGNGEFGAEDAVEVSRDSFTSAAAGWRLY